jgi:hypothetical protein
MTELACSPKPAQKRKSNHTDIDVQSLVGGVKVGILEKVDNDRSQNRLAGSWWTRDAEVLLPGP